MSKVSFFVPGRLCILGEHSDWANNYDLGNNINGYTITTTLNSGISADVEKSDKIILNYLNENELICDFADKDIEMNIKNDEFWKYALGIILYLKKHIKNISGIKVNIIDVTLPMKRGLASSAAISLLITKAYNALYNLNLTSTEELDISYYGELSIGSKCGKLDQYSLNPKGLKLLEFDNDKVNSVKLKVKEDIIIVVANLMKKKDTTKILSDLNLSFNSDKGIQFFLKEKNKQYVFLAKQYIEDGNLKALGKLLTDYQSDFDKFLIPLCSELEAPTLHKTLKDKNIKRYIYGAKGCGSGGDGSVQFIAKNESCANDLINYLNNVLKMETEKVIIKSNVIKKAVIPIGGYGTRMYPMTKVIGKEFLPVMDKDYVIKPAIQILLNEIVKAGIQEICLVIPKSHKKNYINLFKMDKNYDYEMESELAEIRKKVTFVYDDMHLGLANAIKLSKSFIKDDDFILFLGDQIYSTNDDKSCLSQIMDFYYEHQSIMIPVCECKQEEISKYGILSGTKILDDRYYEIVDFVEKPKVEKSEYLKTDNKYYSVFGCYILKNDFLGYLNNDFNNSLKKYIYENKSLAFIPKGKYYDIGNAKDYDYTFINYRNGK